MPRFFALIPCAGSGERLNAPLPKQYLSVAGMPLVYHAITRLCAHPAIEKVFVAIAPQDTHWENLPPLKTPADINQKLVILRAGGKNRAQTVLQTLEQIKAIAHKNDWILVHDAARPGLSENDLRRLIDALKEDEIGGLLATPLADTLKLAKDKERIQKTLPRENLWQAQTPQMFRYGLLLDALQKCPHVTDEASAIEFLGHSPKLIASEDWNFKVTFPKDFALANLLLTQKESF